MGEEKNEVLLKLYPGGGRKIVLTAETVDESEGKITASNITGISIDATNKGEKMIGYQIDKQGVIDLAKLSLHFGAEVCIEKVKEEK